LPDAPKVHQPPAFHGYKRHGGREGRPSSSARGYGAAWQRYRKAYLGRHRWCLRCQLRGMVVAATVVDHIVRIVGPNDPLFWQGSNHQPLCAGCHGAKTRAEGRGERFNALRPWP